MIRRHYFVIGISVLLAFVLGFFGCSVNEITSSKFGAVELILGHNIASRGFYPEIKMDIHSYRIEGSVSNEIKFTEYGNIGETVLINGLAPGDWQITVTGLNEDGEDIGQAVAFVAIKAGQTLRKTITVTEIYGEGLLKLNLTLPSNIPENTPQIHRGLVTLDQPGKDQIEVIFSNNETFENIIDVKELDSGFYVLTIFLYDDKDNVIWNRVETVRIVTNQETVGNIEITAEDIDSYGELDLTIIDGMPKIFTLTVTQENDLVGPNNSLLFTANPSISGNYEYWWFIDGKRIAGESSQTLLQSNDIAHNRHNLSVVAIRGGVMASASITPTQIFIDPLFPQIEDRANWRIFTTTDTYNNNADITTSFNGGIVGDYLDYVQANGTVLAMGSKNDGFSVINLADIHNPKGKVRNYTGSNSNDSSSVFGFSGFATDPNTDKMYAWYDSEIVDVETLTPVYFNAPDYSHSSYSASPIRQFVIDNSGRFWIGTQNLEADGSIRNNAENGLHRITIEDGTATKEEVFTHPVWDLYRDTDGMIWAATFQGLYRINADTKAQTFVEFAETSHSSTHIEQTLEYNGTLYALGKNYFHNANIDTTFELYRYDSQLNKLIFVTNITKENETRNHQSRAFVFDGNLYFAVGNNLKSLNTLNEIVDTELNDGDFGKYCQFVAEDTLYSVGNQSGVSIFSLGEQSTTLTQANTAESLLSSHIRRVNVLSDNQRVVIGPYRSSAFNLYDNDFFSIFEWEDDLVLSTAFNHNGHTYIQGAVTLTRLVGNSLEEITEFGTNGERSVYDPNGYIWSFPNFGSNPEGVIGVMDLESLTVKRRTEPSGNDYFKYSGTRSDDSTLFWDSQFDNNYNFTDVLPIPNSDEVMISAIKGTGDFSQNPHTLYYSHSTNQFTKIPIQDSNSEGILFMATDGYEIYGVARQQLLKLEQSEWIDLWPIALGNDIRGMFVQDGYAVIVSGWNSDGPGEHGGLEVINLSTGKSRYYTDADVPLPSDTIFTVDAQQLQNNKTRIWLGTSKGLAYCEIEFP